LGLRANESWQFSIHGDGKTSGAVGDFQHRGGTLADDAKAPLSFLRHACAFSALGAAIHDNCSTWATRQGRHPLFLWTLE
jgi:hypothetical protein